MKHLIRLGTILVLLFFQQNYCSWHCDLISLSTLVQTNPLISYNRVFPQISFEYKTLPFTQDNFLHPYKEILKENFVLSVPNGKVMGNEGWVLVDDHLISELIWQNCLLHKDALAEAKKNPLSLHSGRLAVITQSGYTYYYHWMVEVLGRLALLELSETEYDHLYIANTAPFMKESLELWGIDSHKIIEASDTQIVQADELVVPSLVSSVMVNGCPACRTIFLSIL